ncbi:hypothetical protein E8E15_004281 [Penicillium rubens]|uniref:Pc21g13290 protein n=2 Tax=Penicillium chrysogenum species complex TaxID=254878 RepID=B6HMT9_PENRW|nr:uncharacterized protein N7525_007886 [Penicillium rubens]XP_056571592.1 uncharacterized protein N7489_001535 [Penicillium chrysogenum]CAP96226.1 Pc21g13290 [Penicillium rubens Wisconsin 54-1255]KAF3018291.1 hypothetical protein E8E15_004281 [Penicillium rubens]KAJ5251125.1 hypothetical protein N7489_001535 [Penicillium chrysogenum]KAJ5262560.1 hypothetical protein N7524_007865 [Penicillium chrysogenum]KAJ5270025.1 hypothetical protein N7505_005783 [Penicillium chrysogenum]
MSRRTTAYERPDRPFSLGTCVLYGCGAGLLGVAAMTVGEKIEQFFTSRPSSYVPGHTLERLLSFPTRPDEERFGLNMAMHYGQGAVAGIIRAIMSANGIRGPFADFMFISVRLLIDQSLENWTQVGAPPWSWPVNEQVIDILHKGVYAFVTGYLTDKWLQ